MPAYANSGLNTLTLNPIVPTALLPGDEKYLFGLSIAAGQPPTPGIQQTPNDSNVVAEAVTVGERSIAVQLGPRPGGGAPAGMIVQISSAANPGASEFDVQDSAVDADGAYATPLSSAAYKISSWTNNGNIWTAYAELQPEGGRFITLKCLANPNAVSFTAKVAYV